MARARVAIVIVGVLLPYLARLPGMLVHGPDWLLVYLGSGTLDRVLFTFLFFGAFQAICWGAVLIATFLYRRAASAWWPAVVGFAFPAVANGMVDLTADAQAAVALVFIPIYSLPLVAVGAFLGLWWDRRRRITSSG